MAGDEEKNVLFEEALPEISKLIKDVFGNYVVQKMFEFGNHQHRKSLY